MPEVSVVIPVYNVEKYLRECLDSVVNQTLKDIEIICVDDGSTDGSPAILAGYAAKDPRVKVLTREKSNAGAARNAGMAVATGEYLGFVDSDDRCEPTLFEKAYARAKADDADVAFFSYRRRDERTGKDEPPRALSPFVRGLTRPFAPADLKLQVFQAFNLAPWNRIVRRSLVTRERLSFQELPRSNDVRFGCLALASAARITFVDEALYVYRTGLSDNLQSGNAKSPASLVEAWASVADSLAACGRLETFAAPLATTAVGALFYMLNTWGDTDVYAVCFAAMKELFAGHRFFGSLDGSRIQNSQSLEYYRLLKESSGPCDFLLRQERFNLVRLSKWLNEGTALRGRIRAIGEAAVSTTTSAPSVSVIVVGSDDAGTEVTERSLADQSLQPVEILRLGDADAAAIADAVAATTGAGVCILRAGTGLESPYSLERAALELELEGPSYLRRPMQDPFGTLFPRDGVTAAVCAYAGGPADVPADGLTDSFRSRLALFAQSLAALDVRHLTGRLCELVAKAAARATDDGARRFLCRLLHEADYEHYREFMSDSVWKTCRADLDRLYNLAYETVAWSRPGWTPLRVERAAERPRLTYVVPAMNVEAYLPRCLESLRRQTVPDLEIICVDDGSWDATGAIMDAYAAADARVTVVHQENRGLGMSRNVAMDRARGEFIAFVDGDDWLAADAAATALERAERCGLDFCSYDMRGFNHLTREPVPFFWNVSRQLAHTPVDRVVSLADFKCLRLSVSACLSVYRLGFLRANGIRFTAIGYGEDMIFTFTVLAKATRFMVLNRPFYNYRRGQPTSMVTRLSAGNNTGDALAVQKEKYLALRDLYRTVYGGADAVRLRKLFRENVVIDILYYTERSDTLRRLFAEGLWDDFDMPLVTAGDVDEGVFRRKEEMERRLRQVASEPPPPPPAAVINAPPLPRGVARRLARVAAARRSTPRDLYVVTGQLNSTANEPIDSWTFFRWLQDNGVPSRYVIWRRHAFYAELVRTGRTKDVIALDGDGVADYEFLDRTEDVLPRVKAVVQENSALNYGIRKWMLSDTDIAHVFLQHGVFFTTFSEAVARILGQFTFVNVSSERERRFMLDRTPPGSALTADKLILGGLPRWDLLKDEPDGGKVVLVMLTWRSSFDKGMERLRESAYYNRLREFLSAENVKRLAEKGVRIVLAPHHHLSNLVRDLDFGVPVETVPPSDVSKWIRRARMLVTDFSSVSVDFLFQAKPVVYWTLDRDDFTLDRAVHDDGGKVLSAERELKALFNVVRTSREAMDLVCRYADGGFALEPENRAIADSFFAGKTGVCRRVYEAVERAIAGKEGR